MKRESKKKKEEAQWNCLVGKVVFVEDDSTIAKTTTNKIAAGRVIRVDDDGVFIDTAHRIAE